MKRHGIWLGILVFLPTRSASAADLKVLPGEITLAGPHASQRLLIAAEEGDAVTGDQTAHATFTSTNPAVAVVDGGAVRPVGDGETTITTTVDGKQVVAVNP